MNATRFEVFRGADKQWYFRLVAGNGKTVCQSEGYRQRAGAIKGVQAVRVAATAATVKLL